MTQPLALGIDIGGTNTVVGIVNRRGEILFRDELPTRGHGSISQFIQQLQLLLLPVMRDMGMHHFAGIGIGVPNGNFFTGEVVFAPNLPWKGVIPLSTLVQETFHLPTVITNDANAAAYGELMYGAAKGMKDFIMVTLGTGVGSGFIANGAIINGHDGLAGELGHVIIERNGRLCGCGRRGCLETYASATGVARTAKELSEKKGGLLMTNSEPTAADVFQAAINGDKVALEIFDTTAEYLGFALANAVAITSPQAIILFGGLTKAGTYLFDPLQNYFEDHLLQIYKNKVSLQCSALPENDAAILGASALAW